MARRVTAPQFYTSDGHPLTPKEETFISAYIETSNGAQSAIRAGYAEKNARSTANKLLTKSYIADEINKRLADMQKSNIASAEEILEFYTKVMRGEIKDQFEMDAPLSERIKAGNELAKRQIDMVNRTSGNEVPEVKITLNWEGFDE